jgi:hypothetical protein
MTYHITQFPPVPIAYVFPNISFLSDVVVNLRYWPVLSMQLVSPTNTKTKQQPPLLVVYLHGTFMSAGRLFHNSLNCLARIYYKEIQDYQGKGKHWTEYSIKIRLEKQKIREYKTK